MVDFLVNSNMKGSLFTVATNKEPRFSSLINLFFLCQCVKCKLTQTHFIRLPSHPIGAIFRWRLNVITVYRKIQAVLFHVHSIHCTFSQAGWWSLNLSDRLFFKPIVFGGQMFCFVTLRESQRWIKEGDKGEEKKKRLPSITKRGWFYEDCGWIQFYCQYTEGKKKKKTKRKESRNV